MVQAVGKQKNRALQGMRAAAFLMVFMSHVYGGRFSHAAAWAVSFFFILSGFLYGYSDRKIEKNPLGFTLKRIRKIYPFYVFSILVSLPFFFGQNRDLGMGVWQNLKNLAGSMLLHLTFLQSWNSGTANTLIGANWFLSTLIFLYLLTPLLVRASRWILKAGPCVLFLAAACMILVDLGVYAVLLKVTDPQDAAFMVYSFPPVRIPEYFLAVLTGTAFCRYYRAFLGEGLLSSAALLLAGGLILAACFILKFETHIWRKIIWVLPNLLVCMLCCCRNPLAERMLGNRVMVFLGDISFELYMIHCIIALYIVRYTSILKEPHTWKAQALVCLITLAASVFTAVGWKRLDKIIGKKMGKA